MLLDSNLVPLKTTRSTQGVQIMRLKKGTFMNKMCFAENSGLSNTEYYRVRSIPAGGY